MKKNLLLSLAVAAGTASAQRLSQQCSTSGAECNSGTCNSYKIASAAGKQCENDNMELTPADDSLSACVDAVVANGACSNVFMYAPEEFEQATVCECHMSADPATSCVVSGAHNSDYERIYEVTENDPFCSCNPYEAGSNELAIGQVCNATEGTVTDAQGAFNDKLNSINDAINSGLVYVETASIVASESFSNYVNDVTLSSAAVKLDRGVDGEVSIDIVLYRDTFPLVNTSDTDEVAALSSTTEALNIVDAAQQAIVNSLAINGVSTTFENFGLLSDPVASVTTCNCPPVVDTLHNCTDSCFLLHAELVVLEVREFYQYELALIILACVLVVCILAVALSYTGRNKDEAPAATKKKVHDEEGGVEMTGGF